MTITDPGHRVGETSEHYPHVILRWRAHGEDDHATRVVECRNRLQWIIQRHISGRWRSEHFCTSRQGLLRHLPRQFHEITAALPERFPL